MSIRIDRRNLIAALIAAGLLTGCTSTTPPALPANNAADPQVRGHTRTPPSLLVRDETTLEVEKELSQTESTAKASESMEHNMNTMPGMQHGSMQGMQHEGMKMEDGEQKKQTGEME